jgi:hypothetical protein
VPEEEDDNKYYIQPLACLQPDDISITRKHATIHIKLNVIFQQLPNTTPVAETIRG